MTTTASQADLGHHWRSGFQCLTTAAQASVGLRWDRGLTAPQHRAWGRAYGSGAEGLSWSTVDVVPSSAPHAELRTAHSQPRVPKPAVFPDNTVLRPEQCNCHFSFLLQKPPWAKPPCLPPSRHCVQTAFVVQTLKIIFIP